MGGGWGDGPAFSPLCVRVCVCVCVFVCACVLCCAQLWCATPSVTGICARGQSAGPLGSNYPPTFGGGRRCSLRVAGLIRLGAQTNLMKDRDPLEDAMLGGCTAAAAASE